MIFEKNMVSKLTFALVASLAVGAQGATISSDPVEVVRTLYATIRSGSDPTITSYGTLGGPGAYREGYAMLGNTFHSKNSLESFLAGFRHTAFIRLIQAEVAEVTRDEAQVFVEDERDMDLEGLPASVCFYGILHLTREKGEWVIQSMELQPERAMISLRDGGHGSAGTITDVVLLALAQHFHLAPGRNSLNVGYIESRNAAERKSGPFDVIYKDPKYRATILLAKLQSGQYVPLGVHDLK